MRISHELAGDIANALTLKSKAANDKLRAEIEFLVFMAYTKKVPKEVVKMEKSFPDWVQKTGSIYVRYRIGDRNRTFITILKTKVITKGGDSDLKPSAVIRKKILQLDKQEEELRALKKDTIRAILALGTTKRVLQQFPDAAPALKAKDKMPVVPWSGNVHDLKAKLQKQ